MLRQKHEENMLISTIKKMKNNCPACSFLWERLKQAGDFVASRGVPAHIGAGGRFRLVFSYAFSDLVRNWGERHNRGFEKWIKVCAGKKIVFDIGAHIGLYALAASRVLNPEGVLFAYEPAGSNYGILQKHIRFNRLNNIKLFCQVVGAGESAAVPFYETRVSSGMNYSFPPGKEGYVSVEREQVSIDSISRRYGILPEVIKIDVEGNEAEVLKGAREVMTRCSPVLFLSLHPGLLSRRGDSAEAVAEILSERGYRIYDMAGRPAGRLVHQEYLVSKG